MRALSNDGSTTSSPVPERIRPAFATTAQRRHALKLFERGLGYKAVAEILGLAPSTVRDWGRAFKRGKFRVELNTNQLRYTDATKVRVVALREDGLSWREISRQTGVNVSTCRAWVLAAEKDASLS